MTEESNFVLALPPNHEEGIEIDYGASIAAEEAPPEAVMIASKAMLTLRLIRQRLYEAESDSIMAGVIRLALSNSQSETTIGRRKSSDFQRIASVNSATRRSVHVRGDGVSSQQPNLRPN